MLTTLKGNLRIQTKNIWLIYYLFSKLLVNLFLAWIKSHESTKRLNGELSSDWKSFLAWFGSNVKTL